MQIITIPIDIYSIGQNERINKMSKKGASMPQINNEPPDPIAPPSPTAKGNEKTAIATQTEKDRAKNSFSHEKTLLSKQDDGNNKKDTLG